MKVDNKKTTANQKKPAELIYSILILGGYTEKGLLQNQHLLKKLYEHNQIQQNNSTHL